jgi:hypothetical protein
MPQKRAYTRPAIVNEDHLEQTSLACNATESFPLLTNGNGTGAFAPQFECKVNVTKGGSFGDIQFCQILVQRGLIVVLS